MDDDRRRVSETTSDPLQDQFRLTQQLPSINSNCMTELDELCAVKAAQNLTDEMACWGCTPEGAWDGDILSFNVLTGAEATASETVTV